MSNDYNINFKTKPMIAVDNRIQLFTDYVAKHLAAPMPTAESIAQEIHMSRSTLFRLVEKELGMSPFQYIRQEKLNKALVLFESSTFQSIKEIANAVGYLRTDHFITIFKDAFDIDLKEHFQ